MASPPRNGDATTRKGDAPIDQVLSRVTRGKKERYALDDKARNELVAYLSNAKKKPGWKTVFRDMIRVADFLRVRERCPGVAKEIVALVVDAMGNAADPRVSFGDGLERSNRRVP